METSGPPISVGIVSLGACAITEPERGFPAGGSELQLYLIARALAAQSDFRVTLHVADLGQAERVEDGIRIHPLARLKPGFRLSPRTIPGLFWRLARAKHDVCVTRSASALTGIVRAASRQAGGRHLHMCAHDDECAGRADASLSRPARWLHGVGLRRADKVACQTTKQIELLKRAFGIEGVLVPNLAPNVYPAKACPRSLPPKSAIGGPGSEVGEPRDGVLWVGRDAEWKQPEVFLELARRLPERRFTMVCQPQAGRDFHAHEAAAPANLKLVAGLPLRDAAALFPRHKVYAMTSRAEGFPNVVLQAVCAGTPVVSLCVDPDGLLSSNKAGFACQGSFEELVRRTAELLSDPALWEEIHAGALRLARRTEGAEEQVIALVRSLGRPEGTG